MPMSGRAAVAWLVAVLSGAVTAAVAGQQLPSEPRRAFGASVTGAFEGWYAQPDGTRIFLVGYLNRNLTQAIDIPIGPNNRIEPGGPDLGQPTHFLPGRRHGMFAIAVPKDFTTPEQRLTWTIVANGQSTTIPLRLHPDYLVSPFTDVAVGNTPPVVRIEGTTRSVQGPVDQLGAASTQPASLGSPMQFTVVVEDDAKYASGTMALPPKPPPPVRLLWSKYRGPGTVTFEGPSTPETLAGGGINAPYRGRATTKVTVSEPGEYVFHLTAMDYSGEGGGGEVCCWTTTMVKASITR